jgi:DNA-binding LacI/PurR family transcriptional regulator
VEHPRIPSVVVDFTAATYQVTQHLLNLQHSRIAYLGGLVNSETSQQRRTGIQTALAEANLSLRPEWCVNSFPNVEGGFQAMSSLLAQNGTERPTAVIAYNDMLAIGALNAIRTHRLRVPEDISVVGFDGISIAAYTNPPLTTINQPKFQMGKLAMRILHAMIQGQEMPGGGYTLMESPLIIRGSTAPPSNES